MFKRLSIVFLPVVALLAVACGSSDSEPTETNRFTASTPAPIPTTAPAAPASAPTTPPVASAAPTQEPAPVQAKVGNSVGDHVPEFEISLSDGTKVTAASLLESQKPTFLFFFTVW